MAAVAVMSVGIESWFESSDTRAGAGIGIKAARKVLGTGLLSNNADIDLATGLMGAAAEVACHTAPMYRWGKPCSIHIWEVDNDRQGLVRLVCVINIAWVRTCGIGHGPMQSNACCL